MARSPDNSWLLLSGAPYGTFPSADHRLWWEVIRRAAHDLRFSHESEALDALEFLRGTGVYLCESLFGVPEGETPNEIAALVHRRNRSRGRELPL